MKWVHGLHQRGAHEVGTWTTIRGVHMKWVHGLHQRGAHEVGTWTTSEGCT